MIPSFQSKTIIINKNLRKKDRRACYQFGSCQFKQSDVSLLFLFLFLAALHSLQDLSSPMRDGTWALCSEKAES